MARWIKHLTSAQVVISWFVSLSPALGSLLSAQSPLQILCPPKPPASLSLPHRTHILSFSLKNEH